MQQLEWHHASRPTIHCTLRPIEHGAHGHHPITLHAVRVSYDTSEQGDGPALLRAGVVRVADAQQQLVLRQVDLDLHTRRPARRRVRQRYPRLRRTIRTVTRLHSTMPCQRRVNGGEARGVRAMSQSSPARGTCARPPTRPGASSGTMPRRIRSARGASAALHVARTRAAWCVIQSAVCPLLRAPYLRASAGNIVSMACAHLGLGAERLLESGEQVPARRSIARQPVDPERVGRWDVPTWTTERRASFDAS